VQQYAPTLQRALLFGLLIILLFLGFNILKYFIVPVVWAAIIAYMTWPIYLWVQRLCGVHRPNLNASLMILLIILVIGVPLTFGIFMLQHEGRNLFFELQKQIFSGHLDVPDFIRELPIIGKEVSRILNDINNDPNSITQNVAAWIQGHMGYGRFVLSEISRNLVKLGFALLSLYFFYRDGPIILSQVSKAMEMVIGPRVHHYLDTISETTRAVVYGVGLTAGSGNFSRTQLFYSRCAKSNGFDHCYLFISFDSFWNACGIYLCRTLVVFSRSYDGCDWCDAMVFVSSVLPIMIRPLVISGATKIPFLLIMFGVLGGLASFGWSDYLSAL
jgi:predicted PurR-regulated permease PerM